MEVSVATLTLQWNGNIVILTRYSPLGALEGKMTTSRPASVFIIWVRSGRCDCLVTWFCYQLIAKPGSKTAAPSWPGPYVFTIRLHPMNMMTSSNGNISCVTDPLRGDFTGHRWILLTKSSYAELWCFLLSAPEQTIEKTIETLVIWDAIAHIMMSL